MSETIKNTETIWIHLKAYIENNIELMKLELADRITDVVSMMVAVLWMSLLALLAVIFIGISLAHVFTLITGYYSLGFFIVAMLYIIGAALLWKGRKRMIKFPLMNILLSSSDYKKTETKKSIHIE